MKVLWFSNTPANGDEYLSEELKGTGGWLKALDKELQGKIELNIAFYSNNDIPFKYNQTKYFPIKRNENIPKKIFRKFTNNVINREDEKKYLDIITNIKPDIIHIHGTENPFGCIINKTKIPIIVSIQGNITVYYHKFFSGIEKKFTSIKNRNGDLFKSLFFPKSFLSEYLQFSKMKDREKKMLENSKYIIGRTSWDYRITRILAPKSVYFHSDEILREGFYKSKWGKHRKEKLIIFTTNGDNIYKGFETLSHALQLLNKLGENVEWRVAGIKEEGLIVKIVKKKLKLNFPHKNLVLLGNLNENDLIQEMLNSDLYVMPSHIENSPNNLCEAMILGMPCIATYAGGTGSLLQDTVDGVLIQDGDPWVMAGAVIELLNNYEMRLEFGLNARKRALTRHNPKRIVASYLDIYNTVNRI